MKETTIEIRKAKQYGMIEPQMKLYGILEIFGSKFFDTEEELTEYVETNDISSDAVCSIEYLGNVAGRSDVIRQIISNGREILYTAVDEDGYGIYNHERSICVGEDTWEFYYGSIADMYAPFRDRGIVFENDIYGKISKEKEKFFEICRKNKLFNVKEK